MKPLTQFSLSARAALFVVLGWFFCNSALAQQTPAAPELSTLRPSAAPAFLLLGVSPTAVDRPATPADLGFSVLNRTEQFTAIPQDYALEVAPYWLTVRQQLGWRKDITRDVAESIQRTATFSAATSELGNEDRSVTGVAGAFSMQLFSGRIGQEMQARIVALEDSLKALGHIYLDYAQAEIERLAAEKERDLRLAAATITDPTKLQTEFEAINKRYEALSEGVAKQVHANPAYQARVELTRKRFENFVITREGPSLEVAGGLAWAFPDQVVDAGKLDRWGVWASYGCERCRFLDGRAARITPLVTVRYLAGVEGEEQETLDFGGRLLLAGNRFEASVEGVFRNFLGDGDEDDLYRIAGILEYQMQNDLWLTASFGRDHNSSREGSLIAQFGIKANFKRQRYQPNAQ